MLSPVGQAARADVVLVADRTPNRVRVRRVVSILAMTADASVGGLLPQDADAAVPLWAAAGLLGGCSPAAVRKSRAEEPCGRAVRTRMVPGPRRSGSPSHPGSPSGRRPRRSTLTFQTDRVRGPG
jgi:hypothetical protein